MRLIQDFRHDCSDLGLGVTLLLWGIIGIFGIIWLLTWPVRTFYPSESEKTDPQNKT